MSKATLSADMDGIIGFAMRGFGPESRKTKELFFQAIDELRNTLTIGRRVKENIGSLNEVYEKGSEENWDGYGAHTITPDAYWEARSFIEDLPSWLPRPDISGSPDGEIVFEWYENPSRLFAISVSGENQLIYAGLYGPNSIRGVTYFGDSIPEVIIDHIQKVD